MSDKVACFLFLRLEKEALKREMLRRIKETKLTLLSMTQDTLHPTTKRTQQENEQVPKRLSCLSAGFRHF